MGFTHLHLHTQYSLLDGVCRLEQLIDKAKETGQTSVAITDHGVMYGAVDFYKIAKQKGIKPIIGCEVYVAARTRHDKVHAIDSERHHLILLCKDNIGYQNLIAMVSESWTSGFYTKPRVDKELLEKYHEGLIALSACIAGEVPSALLRGDYSSAKETALWYENIFGKGNYYIEIQNHGLKEELEVEPQLIKLSKDTGIPLVATNDVHYIEKADSKVQEVLICIQTNNTVGSENALNFGSDEFYFKTEEEMNTLFSHVPEACKNTELIAEKCNVEFEFGKTKLPHFEVPDGREHFDWFREQCYKGLFKRYGDTPPKDYIDRLEYELGVINSMGYVDYYLIVNDYVDFAKSKKIPVGPGRGSGAGSIAAYCIGITDIDPMKYNLIFERFLNPERVSMPDFDVDFCYVRRTEVIDYVISKYGDDHVAQIVTFGTLAARAAIRDVGRAMGIPYAKVDKVAKQIPRELGITIKSALEKSTEFKAVYNSEDEIKELIDMALRVEGMPRNTSTHAAGVVITRDPVYKYVPLALNDNVPVTQYTMTTLEELGLLKMDFLGLRTLTVIDDAVKMIKKKKPDFNIENIDLDSKDVFAMISKGLTEGVFQFESGGMKNVLIRLKPCSVEDLIAVLSLYRPGPMDSIDTYIENRHHPENIKYKTPELKDILEVTNGCLVYQEQVMQVFRTLAGYSFGRADIVRRAMSKKKHKVMEQERKTFIDGCVENNISAETANEIFDDMSSFASYAFNKSHAAAYSIVSYQTAYLKCFYPCEFLAALLSSYLGSSDKVAEYTNECARLKIPVLPPNVNESYEGFTATDGEIRFGLLAIKNLGRGFIKNIIMERRIGKFHSFYDFCKRMFNSDFNKRAVESLIKSGALDNLGSNRRSMMMGMNAVIAELENNRTRNVEGQIGLFDAVDGLSQQSTEPKLPFVEEFPHSELLKMEKDITGLYISGHPMAHYEDAARKMKCTAVSDIITQDEIKPKYNDNDNVKIMGIITSIKKRITKNDTTMATLSVEDIHGSIEVILFSKAYLEYVMQLYETNIAVFYGRISSREDEDQKIICNMIEPLSKYVNSDGTLKTKSALGGNTAEKSRKRLFIKFRSKDDENVIKAEKFLKIFEGQTPLYYYYEDSKEYKKQPSSSFVYLNDPLIDELRRFLGDENVVIQ